MNYKSISDKIIELRNADLACRDHLRVEGQLDTGYHREMNEMHNRNADILHQIIIEIGYPTEEKVGKEAHEAAWLVIQHAIALPDFMRNCAVLLESAVAEQKASPVHLAYLQDRIAVFEGRPQLYGTQYDWDEEGRMSPYDMDDDLEVNARRIAIGLTALDVHIKHIRNQVEKDNERPPADYNKRTAERDIWRRRVGWIV